MLKIGLKIAVTSFFVACGSSAFALDIQSCEDYGVSLNQVTQMRAYGNESIKVFAIDQVEPAAAAVGIAVTIDRGVDLSTAESFCRYVWGLSAADLKQARSEYDEITGLLTVEIPVQSFSDEAGDFVSGLLTLVINKGARSERGLVRATLR
ncbi:MAG: hypothetical protein AB7G93_12485 [Bdellovibrionales bacterium]